MDILIIDDDKFSQKVISKALDNEFKIHLASDGTEGLIKTGELSPDLIILDVEMPGMNGYEVCVQLKQDKKTNSIPIIFLSGCATLRERLQGYEVGGDDYLVKPFESEALNAKIKVLAKYSEQHKELHQQYEVAQNTANIAMTGSSELGLAMHFIEDAFYMHDYEELANLFFTMTDRLALRTTLMFVADDGPEWYSSSGAVSPLETQLLNMIHSEKRFYDFGCRTVISFPNVSLLIKNMPIDNMENYGRIKDLLPVALGALNGKIFTLNTEKAIQKQSEQLTVANSKISSSLLELSNSLQQDQDAVTSVMRKMLDELSIHLPHLGLEDDQEAYILGRIETAVDDSVNLTNSNETARDVFKKVLSEMQQVTEQQNQLIDTMFQYKTETTKANEQNEDYSMDVELF